MTKNPPHTTAVTYQHSAFRFAEFRAVFMVPSHAGISGNERVDSVAHSAAMLGWHCFLPFKAPFYLAICNPSGPTFQ